MIRYIKEWKKVKEDSLRVALTYVPTDVACSIIGAGRLDFRVRNGAGYDPPASSTTERRINTLVFMLLSFEKLVNKFLCLLIMVKSLTKLRLQFALLNIKFALNKVVPVKDT